MNKTNLSDIAVKALRYISDCKSGCTAANLTIPQRRALRQLENDDLIFYQSELWKITIRGREYLKKYEGC